jgi:NADPH-ferrihemoprotein reductase
VDTKSEEIDVVMIGEHGEGYDGKSVKEDCLEWKDGMWDASSKALRVEEGQGRDASDFVVNELESHPEVKVYLGLSLPFSRQSLP